MKKKRRISETDKHQLQRNFHLKTLDGGRDWRWSGNAMHTEINKNSNVFFFIYKRNFFLAWFFFHFGVLKQCCLTFRKLLKSNYFLVKTEN